MQRLLAVALLAFDGPGVLSLHPSPSISMASHPGEEEPARMWLPSSPHPRSRGNRQTPVVDGAFLFGSAVNCQVPLYLSLRCICQSVTTSEMWNWEVHSLGDPLPGFGTLSKTLFFMVLNFLICKIKKWVLSSLILPFIQCYPFLLEFSPSQKKSIWFIR